MGRKDSLTVAYLSNHAHFADMYNGALFHGKEVVRASELMEVDKELPDIENLTGIRRDNVTRWVHGVQFAILVVENQSNIDFHMVLRNMYAESLEYLKQWREKREKHKEKKDLASGDEFISGMKPEEKFAPVVMLVVNYGENPWYGPRTLHELLELDGENERLKPFITNYKLNIFDYHDYEDFDQFHTELGVLFEFLRYAKDKDQLRKRIAEKPQDCYNVSNEMYRLIAELTHTDELLRNADCVNMETGGKNMCKAFEDMKLEGIEEGMEAMITTCQELEISRAVTACKLQEKFNLDDTKTEEYMERFWK